MPPKRKPRNAFLIFTTDWKSKEERHGNQHTFAEATKLAGEIWNDMTAAERAPYTNKAKEEKYDSKKSNEKYTSMGVPLSHIENAKKEGELKQKIMKKDIANIVQNSVINDSIADQKYYFIMTNYFTKTINDGIYLPAEIAVSEYSLRNGINKKFHSFVNPGVDIFGHAYEAQLHTEKTHQLPLPPNALGEKNLGKLYDTILNFINPNGEKIFPPVFTTEENMPIAKSILKFLSCDADNQEIVLDVYSIQYLYYILKTATAEKGNKIKPESVHITDVQFNRDYFEYHPGISCVHHEKIDKSKFCALSCVVRWGYLFSDFMCQDIGLIALPGSHVPQSTDMSQTMSTTASYYEADSNSVVSMQSSAVSHVKEGGYCYRERHQDAGIDIGEEFPPLGGAKKKIPKKENSFDNSTMSISNRHDETLKEENPWSRRSRVVPRMPVETSFDFDHIVAGRGRGLLIPNDSSLNESRISARGRGMLLNSLSESSGPSSSGRGRMLD